LTFFKGLRLKTVQIDMEMSPDGLHANRTMAMREPSPSKLHGHIWSPHPIRPALAKSIKHGFASDSPDIQNYEVEPLGTNLFSGIYPRSQGHEQFYPAPTDSACGSYVPSPLSHCRSNHSLCAHSHETKVPIQKESASSVGYEKSSNQGTVPGKNVIDLDRIARGLDTRTTVSWYLYGFM
jgi:hypothetical protein